MRDAYSLQFSVSGRVRGHVVAPGGGLARTTPWRPNLVLYEMTAAIANLLTSGTREYRVSGMYLEYGNVVSPGTAVTAPAFTRADGGNYYSALASSPDIDYLRVPVASGLVDVSDATLYPRGNVSQFLALTQGTSGVNGKPFSDAYNSTVFGGALVVMRDPNDPSQDLVVARHYLSAGAQLPKPPGLQVALEWEIIWQ